MKLLVPDGKIVKAEDLNRIVDGTVLPLSVFDPAGFRLTYLHQLEIRNGELHAYCTIGTNLFEESYTYHSEVLFKDNRPAGIARVVRRPRPRPVVNNRHVPGVRDSAEVSFTDVELLVSLLSIAKETGMVTSDAYVVTLIHRLCKETDVEFKL